MDKDKIIIGDCIDGMRELPDGCVDLVIADPPYNMDKVREWDHMEADRYYEFCRDWIRECVRVLRPQGVMYIWHNDMAKFYRIIAMAEEAGCILESFCIWDKGNFRNTAWCGVNNSLRSWFNICEYVVHFVKGGRGSLPPTGLARVLSTPECFRSLKDWYRKELERLGKTERDLMAHYKAVTGRGDGMFRHYFKDTQFEIPTEAVYNAVFRPFGFVREYESLRAEYESLREYHRTDEGHCNVFRHPAPAGCKKIHPTQKPEAILRRLIRVSCPPGGLVLDPFSGSGSTAAAAVLEGRHYIGFEKSQVYYDKSLAFIRRAAAEAAASSTARR